MDTLRLAAGAKTSNLEEASRWVKLVGFRFKANDHWVRIGLNQDECAGLQVCLQQRIERTRRLLGLCVKLVPRESNIFEEWLEIVKRAANECGKDLNKTRRGNWGESP